MSGPCDKRCVMCGSLAEVQVSWPVTGGVQSHAVCGSCGRSIWEKINRESSGTESCMCFSIELLNGGCQ